MTIGDRKSKYIFHCQGWVPPAEMRTVARELVKVMGMTPARSHPVDDYPMPDGTGGHGYTLFQPLTESYLVVDVYYDLNETDILVSTCKPDRMSMDAIKAFLSGRIGPTMGWKLWEE